MINVQIKPRNMFQEYLLNIIEPNVPPNSIFLKILKDNVITIMIYNDEITMQAAYSSLTIKVNRKTVYKKKFSELHIDWVSEAWEAIKKTVGRNEQ